MKIGFLGLALVFFVGCGVKGKPLPPLIAPPIGRVKPVLKDDAKVKLGAGKKVDEDLRSPREEFGEGNE